MLERTVTRQDSIVKLLDRLQTKLETIEKHDGLQEERMAQMQEAIAVLTGVLGWDILPKFLKAGIATLM